MMNASTYESPPKKENPRPGRRGRSSIQNEALRYHDWLNGQPLPREVLAVLAEMPLEMVPLRVWQSWVLRVTLAAQGTHLAQIPEWLEGEAHGLTPSMSWRLQIGLWWEDIQ